MTESVKKKEANKFSYFWINYLTFVSVGSHCKNIFEKKDNKNIPSG